MKAIGIDPGICSCGYCLTEIPENIRLLAKEEIGKAIPILCAGVVRTKKDKNIKLITRDRARRVMEICKKLLQLRRLAGPDTVLWVAETFTVNPQSRVTNASIQTLSVYGAVQGLAAAFGDIFLPVMPAQAKGTLTGLRSSSKEQVYAVRAADLESAAILSAKPWPRGQNEHVGDSLSVVSYGVYTYSQVAQGFF